MKCELVLVVMMGLVGFFGGFCEAQEVAIKFNQTGKCFANNSNCDWFVGVWSTRFDLSGYSCSGNGGSTFPQSPSDLCCTDVYTIDGICVAGYREDNGVMVSLCVLEGSTFNNKTAKQPAFPTLRQNIYTRVVSLEGGLQTVDGEGNDVCYPLRQLTTDNWVANWNSPAFAAGNPSCPEYPDSAMRCNAISGQTNIYLGSRRRIPASRFDGYHVTKNFNSKGTCDIKNGNCDWFAGSWNGFVIGQGFSSLFVQGLQEFVLPLTPSDVLCAASPYLVAYTCENGYSTITGHFVSYCHWGAGQIIPVNTTLVTLYGVNGALHVEEYSEYRAISSLRNGIQFESPELGISGCVPMDRIDTDTVIGNFDPIFPAINCTDENISPDVDVRCEENGDLSVNIGYFGLTRVAGGGFTGGPIYIASSGMNLQPVMVLMMFFLGFLMMM